MEIHSARLTSLGPTTEGVNKQGNPWRKATATFETIELYPKTVAVDFFNSRLEDVAKIPLGTVCKVNFDINSREWNGKWYTDLTGFGIEATGATQAAQQPSAYQQSFDQPLPPLAHDEPNGDLPF